MLLNPTFPQWVVEASYAACRKVGGEATGSVPSSAGLADHLSSGQTPVSRRKLRRVPV